MGNYSSLPSKSEEVRTILNDNYSELEANFTAFFAELIDFVVEDQKVDIKKPDLTTGF